MPIARPSLPSSLALYLVADPDQTRHDLVDVVSAAVAAGVTAVQLRAKSLSDRAALALAHRLAGICRENNALFFVNDRLDLALAAGADGLHLGVDDLPLAVARGLGGPNLVIGYSPETDDQARRAATDGADYLGIGPVFGTVSKGDAGPAVGLVTIARRSAMAGIPTIGIGGITRENAASVIAAGAVGVGVVGAILRAADPGIAARELAATVFESRIGSSAR